MEPFPLLFFSSPSFRWWRFVDLYSCSRVPSSAAHGRRSCGRWSRAASWAGCQPNSRKLSRQSNVNSINRFKRVVLLGRATSFGHACVLALQEEPLTCEQLGAPSSRGHPAVLLLFAESWMVEGQNGTKSIDIRPNQYMFSKVKYPGDCWTHGRSSRCGRCVLWSQDSIEQRIPW